MEISLLKFANKIPRRATISRSNDTIPIIIFDPSNTTIISMIKTSGERTIDVANVVGLICKIIATWIYRVYARGCSTRYTYGKQRFRGSSAFVLFAVQQGKARPSIPTTQTRVLVSVRVCLLVCCASRQSCSSNFPYPTIRSSRATVCLSFARQRWISILDVLSLTTNQRPS